MLLMHRWGQAWRACLCDVPYTCLHRMRVCRVSGSGYHSVAYVLGPRNRYFHIIMGIVVCSNGVAGPYLTDLNMDDRVYYVLQFC